MIPKTDIIPETADTSKDGIIIKRENMAVINNVITREVTRVNISKGVITIIITKAVINNEGITIKEEVTTGQEDTNRVVTTKVDIIRVVDTSKEEDIITRGEDIIVAETSNNKADTSKEDPEVVPICADHNKVKVSVAIILSKAFQDP
jgi:hypothetical protein